jgi:hypothetical protein
MSDERKRPSAAFWIIVALIAAALYVLSGVPAELMLMKVGEPEWLVVPGKVFYAPLVWLLDHIPDQVADWYREAYGGWWMETLSEP